MKLTPVENLKKNHFYLMKFDKDKSPERETASNALYFIQMIIDSAETIERNTIKVEIFTRYTNARYVFEKEIFDSCRTGFTGNYMNFTYYELTNEEALLHIVADTI